MAKIIPQQFLSDPKETELIDKLGKYFRRPLEFVRFSFPWGEPGQLEDQTGPDDWQVDILTALSRAIIAGEEAGEAASAAIQIAVASGHGVGKSALVAWIIIWFMSTRPNPQVVVTANTKTQLTTKTWRELSKWHKLSINKHWFTWHATSFSHVLYPETWCANAIPWSEHNSEAFAGTHEKHVLLIFDEASAVADTIWEVSEGALTTSGAIRVCFGNPTKNTGKFSECFGKSKHRWITRQIDSRTAKMANKIQIQQWIDDYGEDHDFVRVRVKGMFPRASSMQFISSEVVRKAMQRKAETVQGYPLLMALDVARHGDDQSAIARRQGNVAYPINRYRIADTMELTRMCAARIMEERPLVFFIDVTGMGWGVYDRLREMGFRNVIPVQTGMVAADPKKYFNLRAEIWGLMKEWIEGGATLPEDMELESDLTGPEYGYDDKFRVRLEKKEDMKKRGLSSPDSGDALALTFAFPVAEGTLADHEENEYERDENYQQRHSVTGY